MPDSTNGGISKNGDIKNNSGNKSIDGSGDGGNPAAGRRPGPENPPPGEAWGIIGTLVAGAGFWGLVGWGLDQLVGFRALFFPIGLIVGVIGSIYLVIYRFGARR